jgi:hypothetical protein
MMTDIDTQCQFRASIGVLVPYSIPEPARPSSISSPLARDPASRKSAGPRPDLRARMSLATPSAKRSGRQSAAC